MTDEEALALTSVMVELGVLWRPDGPKQAALRARLWRVALADEGITFQEARAAALELSRLPADVRITNARPGDVVEAALNARVARVANQRALPPAPCDTCRGSGFEIITRCGVDRARPCSCRGQAQVSA